MIILRQKLYSKGEILGNGQSKVLSYKDGQRVSLKKAASADYTGLAYENATKGKGRFHSNDRNGYVYQVKNRFINSSRNGKNNVVGESFNASTYIDKGEKLSTVYKHHLKLHLYVNLLGN